MTHSKTLALFILVPFLALTCYALYKVGLIGLFHYHLLSPAGWQVFVDLVIALMLVLMFMSNELRAQGRPVWPWIVATLCTGSIAPLIYLIFFRRGQQNLAKS